MAVALPASRGCWKNQVWIKAASDLQGYARRQGLYRMAWEVRRWGCAQKTATIDEGEEEAGADGDDQDDHSHDNDPYNLILQILYTD